MGDDSVEINNYSDVEKYFKGNVSSHNKTNYKNLDSLKYQQPHSSENGIEHRYNDNDSYHNSVNYQPRQQHNHFNDEPLHYSPPKKQYQAQEKKNNLFIHFSTYDGLKRQMTDHIVQKSHFYKQVK